MDIASFNFVFSFDSTIFILIKRFSSFHTGNHTLFLSKTEKYLHEINWFPDGKQKIIKIEHALFHSSNILPDCRDVKTSVNCMNVISLWG